MFYLNCAGGAAFHNLSHVRQTIQDAGFASCRVDDVSRELGLLSVQGSNAEYTFKSGGLRENWAVFTQTIMVNYATLNKYYTYTVESQIYLQGPDSRKVLGRLIDGGEEALSNERFPFYTHKVIEIAGHKVIMVCKFSNILPTNLFIT